MKLKLLSLLLGMSLLTGCASTVYESKLEVYCLPLKSYSNEFNEQLAKEIEKLPNDSKRIEQAISDYVALRDQIRACEQARDKLQSK